MGADDPIVLRSAEHEAEAYSEPSPNFWAMDGVIWEMAGLAGWEWGPLAKIG